MKFTFLGTGTSQGVPVIGCKHPVCLSDDPRDKRLRTSGFLEVDGVYVLFDCGPDFRQQALNNNIVELDAVFLTHEHNDHVLGLDDLRPFIYKYQSPVQIYAHERTLSEVKNRFPYAFSEVRYPGAPKLHLASIKAFEAVQVKNVEVYPIPITHGKLEIFGFKVENFAYITDASFISNETIDFIKGVDILVINALRIERKHDSHFILPETLEFITKITPKKAYIVHCSFEIGFYKETSKLLPTNVFLAYDGLTLTI